MNCVSSTKEPCCRRLRNSLLHCDYLLLCGDKSSCYMGVIRNRYVGCKAIVGRFDRLFCLCIAELHIYATELLLNIPLGLAI